MDSPAKPAAGRMTRYRIETKSLSCAVPPSIADGLSRRFIGTTPIPPKVIIRDVDCEARPGELLAIVGPSGAGKSTLLAALAGMLHPTRITDGEILVNGRRMDPSRFCRVSGYVTQDDALFPLLTVEESLLYSARLRLADGDPAVRVAALLKELGLDRVATTRVSRLSGGERRRVSIGVELVHDPAVLLLDEPTSGLDSAAALNIVAMLKTMAAVHGRTVVLTVHQPGFRILELLDRVLLLAGGTVRHQGTLPQLGKRLAEAGHLVPPHTNVLEFAMDALSTLVSVDTPLLPTSTTSTRAPAIQLDRVFYANSRCGEVAILAERFFKNTLRTKQLFAARMLQCAIVGFGLGSIFFGVHNMRARVGFFAFSLTFLLSSTTEALPVFLQERRILMRETARGAYRVASYVAANTIIFAPFLLAAALLYSTPVYWLVGLRREFDGYLYFAGTVWVVMLAANAFVACFSALVPNFIMGNSVIAGLMGSFFLFSGYFISKDDTPVYWVFMHYLSLFKYPFEGFLINEYGGERGRKECLQWEGGVCVMDGGMFLSQQGLVESEKWSNLGVMMGFVVGYRVLCFVILWFRCCKIRR